MRYLVAISFVALILLLESCKRPPVTTSIQPKENLYSPDTAIITPPVKDTVEIAVTSIIDSIRTKFIISTFLGGEKRNYYGNLAPDMLNVKWRLHLGTGKTKVGSSTRTWSGAGWTGQPLMVSENDKKYLIQGSYDHYLRKIDVENQEIVWKYKFDDVIKGTGSLWFNKKERSDSNKIVIFQGSRYGYKSAFRDKIIPSFRAISYSDGQELWRLNNKLTDSYSRDVDASALIIKDTLYIGLENGLFTVLKPDRAYADSLNGIFQPQVLQEHLLYNKSDVIAHRRNVVTESSPSKIGNHIYIASGSGHVLGYNMDTDSIDWDFYVGSDIDGSAVVTEDSCLIISVEKQYIKGKGGALKLDPSKHPSKAVVWYQPVDDREFVSWEGGIIGTVGVNDSTKNSDWPNFAAISAIDGHLYIINTMEFERNSLGKEILVPGFDGKTKYRKPKLVKKIKLGASISTPIFVKNKLIAAGYGGIYLFRYDKEGNFKLLDKFVSSFESTPIAIDGSIYIASRNGYLYCFGDE